MTYCITSRSNDLIKIIKGCGTASEDQLKELTSKHDDVYFTNVSIVSFSAGKK